MSALLRSPPPPLFLTAAPSPTPHTPPPPPFSSSPGYLSLSRGLRVRVCCSYETKTHACCPHSTATAPPPSSAQTIRPSMRFALMEQSLPNHQRNYPTSTNKSMNFHPSWRIPLQDTSSSSSSSSHTPSPFSPYV